VRKCGVPAERNARDGKEESKKLARKKEKMMQLINNCSIPKAGRNRTAINRAWKQNA